MVLAIIILFILAIAVLGICIFNDDIEDTLKAFLTIAGIALLFIGLAVAVWYDSVCEHTKTCKEYRIDRIDQLENDSIVSTKYEIHYWK